MADPQPSGLRPPETNDRAEQDARIELLLVTGLDHYFVGEFEPAINLWTRVLFLDRSHDRARAYIDRARSAQAERQRASEALVHQGLEAFDRGEVAQARALLSDALGQGASQDLALGVLGRIDRLDVGPQAAPVPVRTPARMRGVATARPAAASGVVTRGRETAGWWVAVCAGAAVTAGLGVWASASDARLAGWWSARAPAGPSASQPVAIAPLPIPEPSEAHLSSASALFASGKLRDALLALDRVPLGDSLRQDADRLRGRIQRELLAVAAGESVLAPVAEPFLPPVPE